MKRFIKSVVLFLVSVFLVIPSMTGIVESAEDKVFDFWSKKEIYLSTEDVVFQWVNFVGAKKYYLEVYKMKEIKIGDTVRYGPDETIFNNRTGTTAGFGPTTTEFNFGKLEPGVYGFVVAPDDNAYCTAGSKTCLVPQQRTKVIRVIDPNDRVIVTGVSLDKSSIIIQDGESDSLTAVLTPNDATITEVTWASSDNSVVKVTNDGGVVSVSPGTAIITVTTVDGNHTDFAEVIVLPIPVEDINLSPSITIGIGKSKILVAKVSPSNASDKRVFWSSSDIDVAIVSEKGVVTGKAEGESIITATTYDGGFSASNTVTITQLPEYPSEINFMDIEGTVITEKTISLAPENYKKSITLDMVGLYVEVEDAEKMEFSLTTSNAAVVGVAKDNSITIKKLGTVELTATTVNGITKTIVLKIRPRPTKWYWPVEGKRITGYLWRKYPGHNGIDIKRDNDVKSNNRMIYAANDGEVVKVVKGCSNNGNLKYSAKKYNDPNISTYDPEKYKAARCGGGWGNYVLIKHKDENGNTKYFTRYAHLVQNEVYVKVGDYVFANDKPIGKMGASGYTTPGFIHLHFELMNAKKKRKNPLNFAGITEKASYNKTDPNSQKISNSLPAPTGLTAISTGTAVELNWTPVPEAISYNIQYINLSTEQENYIDFEYSTFTDTKYFVNDIGYDTYEFQVQAVLAEDDSDWAIIEHKHIPTAPVAPATAKATWKSSTTATVSWEGVPGATTYEVQYKSSSTNQVWKTDPEYKTKTATSYKVTNLGVKTYGFRVRAVNAVGKSEWTTISYKHTTSKGTSTLIVPPLVTAPAMPSNFEVTKASETAVKVFWTAVPGATSYEVVYLSDETNEEWITDSDYKTKTATSYISTGIDYLTYEFQVRAVNNSGASEWAIAEYEHLLPEAPLTPTDLKAIKASETTLTLSWSAATRATSYEVRYRKQGSNNDWTTDSSYSQNTAVSYTSKQNEFVVYEYQVRAINAGGTSDWVTVTYEHLPITATAPTGLKATKTSSTTATISWNAVPGATSYEVQYKSNNTNNAWTTDPEYKTKTASSYKVTNLGVKTYGFRVRAVNAGGKSDWITISYAHK